MGFLYNSIFVDVCILPYGGSIVNGLRIDMDCLQSVPRSWFLCAHENSRLVHALCRHFQSYAKVLGSSFHGEVLRVAVVMQNYINYLGLHYLPEDV